MALTAIICEYNPFHKGHQYQLNEVRRFSPESNILTVMSPNFVQRGKPAIFDKYVRGECAVRCGADLAVSMPLVFALLSAEGFAQGGVQLASKLGADTLAFGVENDDLDALIKISKVLISEEFENELSKEVVASPFISYPTIRQNVLEKFAGAALASIISTPNNILAIEYIKAGLRYCPNLKFMPIKRKGNSYDDLSYEGELLSASAIRNIIEQNNDWHDTVPEEVYRCLNSSERLDTKKYESFLYSTLSVASYDRILLSVGSKELADIIYSAIKRHGDFSEFRASVSRKKFTETKIDRALTNILLGVGNDEYMHAEPEYACLLAMNSKGRKIASSLRKSDAVLISRFAECKKLNSTQLNTELLADRIWARCKITPEGEEFFINKRPYLAEE